MTMTHEHAVHIVFDTAGIGHCVYDERIDLHALGALSIKRGSHVEPDSNGDWVADLSPVDGPTLGPFRLRSEALEAERNWLERHWLYERS